MSLVGKIIVIKFPVTSEILVDLAEDFGDIKADDITEEMLKKSFTEQSGELGEGATLEIV